MWSKWVPSGLTLFLALLAFGVGYGALQTEVENLQKNYVTKDEWRNGFIEWTGWRSGVDKELANMNANITLLRPSAPRYSRPDAERDHDRLVRLIKDIERQVHELENRVDECMAQ